MNLRKSFVQCGQLKSGLCSVPVLHTKSKYSSNYSNSVRVFDIVFIKWTKFVEISDYAALEKTLQLFFSTHL